MRSKPLLFLKTAAGFMSATIIKFVLSGISKRNDLMLALLLVAIIVLIILPMPTVLVDVLIALNMGLSTILLMTAIYLKGPLEFSTFPSVLLVTTLFPTGVVYNHDTIDLVQGDAGEIVYTFGNFVVGGNLTVGIVIFLIITIVQFLVITKGSERVAEVSARFSSDGMPGKQMSIDADMRGALSIWKKPSVVEVWSRKSPSFMVPWTAP